jgi:hypothetical protein
MSDGAEQIAMRATDGSPIPAAAAEQNRAKTLEGNHKPTPEDRHTADVLLRLSTSRELVEKHFEPMRWLLQDLVPAEGLTVLGSKMGNGKSFFLLQLAAALSEGTDFLGRRTDRQGVLYIALEDSDRRIHDRLNQLRLLDSERLFIATTWSKGEKALKDLKIVLTQHPEIRVVIIDPIVRFLDLLDENSYAEAYGALSPLKELLDIRQVAGIFSHHCKKAVSELDAFDELLGSTGWGAACDTRLVLRRQRGHPEGTLVAGGRDVIHSENALLFDGGNGWKYQGTAEDVRLSDARREILELLDEEGPLSATEISKRFPEKSFYTTRNLVQRLVESGRLFREGKKVALVPKKAVVHVVPVVQNGTTETTDTTRTTRTTHTTGEGGDFPEEARFPEGAAP